MFLLTYFKKQSGRPKTITKTLLCLFLAGLLLSGCKKKDEPPEPAAVLPVQIISPADGAFVHDSVPIVFTVNPALKIIRTECYVDFQLFEAYDSVPAKIYFNAGLFVKGSTHHYNLKIITKDGFTSNSNILTLVISKLSRPAVTVDFLTKTSLKLTWADNSNNESGYRVKRKEGNNNYSLVGNLDPATLTFTDLNLDTTKSYSYLVEVYSSQDETASDTINIAYFLNRYHFYNEYVVPNSVEGKIVISPDLQKVIVTNYWDDNFTVINTATGMLTSLYQDGGSMGLAMSHSGNFFASGGTHDWDLIKIWDMNTLSLIRQFKAGASNYALLMNNNDEQLVVGGEPVHVFNTGDGSLVKKFSVTNAIGRSVDLSQDESLLLTGGNDNLVKLYNATSGTLIRTFTGHTGHVGAAIFSSDETKIISGSYEDNTIIIWDANSGNILKTITMGTSTVSICNGKNGEVIIAGVNGNISVMNMDGEMIQEFKEFNMLLAIDVNTSFDVIAAYGSSTVFKVKLFGKSGHWEVL